jgi:serine/threonine-protein kinase
MRDTVLIKAKQRSATPVTDTARRRRGGVPAALLQDAPRRLRIATFVILVLIALAMVAGVVVHALGLPGPPNWVIGVQAILFTGTLVLHLITRNRRIPPERIVDLGMFFYAIGAFALALAENLPPRSPDIEYLAMGISRVTVWIVIFPVIVPNTPLRSVLGGILAASMGPLTYYLTVAVGNPLLSPVAVAKIFSPNYAAVALSAIPILILHKLGQHASKATELGSYRLVELLGRGGMGEVWRADHRMLARPAAIKLISPEALGAADGSDGPESTSTVVRRFEREAQATAALTSPHTIELYDFGVADDGTFYYVMELLNGLDLDTLVQRVGPLPPERVVHIMQQVCCSLADAHLSHMIHRDIKPANVFLCRRGVVYDYTKLLDFGLVRSQSPTAEDGGRLTVEGITTGTPAFMPPEMALGKLNITPQADLYSAGCVAYWLLTGRLVFEGETAMEMIVNHAQSKPSPPSEASELGVPEALDRIILQCLEKNPAERPASAEELAAALSDIELEVQWTQARARKWWEVNLPEFTRDRPTAEETDRLLLAATDTTVRARHLPAHDSPQSPPSDS